MFFQSLASSKLTLPTADSALPGRDEPILRSADHAVNGHPLFGPYPPESESILFGMGCFWGAERLFWRLPGVWVTAVGYAGGFTRNPTYEEVCSGRTGHTEVVKVVYRPTDVPLEQLLQVFWESHDPTQGMRQGNDRGTQYRSAIYCESGPQEALAVQSRERFGAALSTRGFGPVTTEIALDQPFFPAESWHQQYLHKNPGGYCGLQGTGVSCPEFGR